jgi:chemotaxis protein methyltransferase CheR
VTALRAILPDVREALGRRYGLRLDEISEETLLHAVEGAASEAGIAGASAALGALAGREDQNRFVQDLIRRVTIGETTFFRHPEDVAWLREAVAGVVERRRRAGTRLVRMWSAGCSTGEEPYTLAMLALEAGGNDLDVQVLGTDINRSALAAAERAEYGDWSFRGVSDETRRGWFEKTAAGRWRPSARVRGCVTFDYLNLRDPIYPAIFTRTTDLDGILCRNVFIYFHPEVVAMALARMAECVKGDGFILCGPSDILHCEPPLVLETAGGVGPGRHRLRRRGEGRSRTATAAPGHLTPARVQALRSGRAATSAPAATAAGAPLATHADILAALRAGRYNEAATAAEARLTREPLDVDAARLAALAWADLEDPRTIDAWKKVLYLAATDAGAHMGLALAYRRLKRDADARRHFRQVVRLLEGRSDKDTLPGPDALTVDWVRQMCRSLGREPGDKP